MFYPNRLVGKKITYKKYKYASFANGLNVKHDENLTPIKYSKNTYNFNYNNGALESGLGVRYPEFFYYYEGEVKTKIPNHSIKMDFIGLWYYNYYREESYNPNRYIPVLIAYTKTGSLFYLPLHSTAKEFGLIPNLHLTSTQELLLRRIN